MKTFYSLVLLIPVLISCGGSSSSGGSSNGISTSFTTVSSAIDAVGGISDVSGKMHSKLLAPTFLVAPEFGASWTDNSAVSSVRTGDLTSIKEYFGEMLDPDLLNDNDAKFNALGRMKNSLAILCAIGIGMDAAGVEANEDGYPSATFSFTITEGIAAQLISVCGFAEGDGGDMVGGVPEITVETVSGDTYDVKLVFDGEQDFYYRSNADEINIMSPESNSGGGVSRSILAYDKATKIMRVEYTSTRGTADDAVHGLEAHRLYYDETNDDAMILSLTGQSDDDPDSPTVTTKSRFIIAGKPEAAGGQFSISAKLANFDSHAKYEACVDGSTGDISDDGVRCVATSSASNGADITTATCLSDVITHQDETDWRTGADETTVLTWDNKTEMLTEAFYQ